MAGKLKEEYEKWALKINMEKTKYMAIGDKSKDLVLEDGQGNYKNESKIWGKPFMYFRRF